MARNPYDRLIRSNDPASDPINGLLAEVRVIAASVASFSLRGDWAIAMAGSPHFYLVAEGECWAEDRVGRSVRLRPGDCVLALGGARSVMASRRDHGAATDMETLWTTSRAPPATTVGYRRAVTVEWGEGVPGCRLIGSAMTLSRVGLRAGIVRDAPPLIVGSIGAPPAAPVVEVLGRMLFDNPDHAEHGYAALCTAIVQLVVVQVLREFLTSEDGSGERWNRDPSPGLTRLIRGLHVAPSRTWTIAEMAREAGMSRTAFIERFTAMTGDTPAVYRTRCRIERAADALGHGATVAAAAELSGYISERAFRTAFTSAFGLSPSRYRHSRRRPDER